MLTGRYPFLAKTKDDLFNKIKQDAHDMNIAKLNDVS